MKTIVLDPGHGGNQPIHGSSYNNATSASGVKEKDICLDIARRIRFTLHDGTAAEYAQSKGFGVKVIMTRDSDVNLGLGDRAAVAATNNAALYLSVHCNSFNGSARGTECWIDRKYMVPKYSLGPGKSISQPGPGIPSSGLRNVNVAGDAAFAKTIVDATVDALKKFDSAAKLRRDRYSRSRHGETYHPPEGVKMMGLGTLRDAKLGTNNNNCLAALLELEFIDNPKVDVLLNGANAVDVRNLIAANIGIAIVDQLQPSPPP